MLKRIAIFLVAITCHLGAFLPDSCLSGEGYLGIDLLYWRAHEAGLDVLLTDTVEEITPEGILFFAVEGRDRDPHFKWNAGFRLEAGYEFDNNWDLFARWSHFRTHAHYHLGNDIERLRWRVKFNELDLLTSYRVQIGPCFTLRPFFGLKAARIDQRFREFDVTNVITSVGLEAVRFSALSDRQNYEGIGPKLGLEVEINVGCGVSVFTSGATSYLYGHYDVRIDQFIAISRSSITASDIKRNLHNNQTVLDGIIGLRWIKCMETTHLFVELFYEQHRYFDHNYMSAQRGDLSFEGVSLSFGLEY